MLPPAILQGSPQPCPGQEGWEQGDMRALPSQGSKHTRVYSQTHLVPFLQPPKPQSCAAPVPAQLYEQARDGAYHVHGGALGCSQTVWGAKRELSQLQSELSQAAD